MNNTVPVCSRTVCTHKSMPCYDDSRDDTRFDDMKKKLDKLTRLLCESMKLHEKIGTRQELMTFELQSWWDDHKKFDARRELEEAKEKIRRSHKRCRPFKGLCTNCKDRAFRHPAVDNSMYVDLCCDCFTKHRIAQLEAQKPK